MKATERDRATAARIIGTWMLTGSLDRLSEMVADERERTLLEAADALYELSPDLDWDDWLRDRSRQDTTKGNS